VTLPNGEATAGGGDYLGTVRITDTEHMDFVSLAGN
jgi:hypothetical protein